jgi:hypothetical protein
LVYGRRIVKLSEQLNKPLNFSYILYRLISATFYKILSAIFLEDPAVQNDVKDETELGNNI